MPRGRACDRDVAAAPAEAHRARRCDGKRQGAPLAEKRGVDRHVTDIPQHSRHQRVLSERRAVASQRPLFLCAAVEKVEDGARQAALRQIPPFVDRMCARARTHTASPKTLSPITPPPLISLPSPRLSPTTPSALI